MKKQLAILDFTRMMGGKVCFAGVDQQGQTIRPTFRGWIEEKSLLRDGRLMVYPFAVIDLEVRRAEPDPPHCEDWESNPWSIRYVKDIDHATRIRLLRNNLFPCVRDIFETEIHAEFGHYVKRGTGARSLGTIQPAQVEDVFYDRTNGRWRLSFIDEAGESYCLSITDRTWWAYHHIRQRKGCTLDTIVAEIRGVLSACEEIYLRIGLSRNWSQHPDCCFLQINAVYPFPNYLGGYGFSTILQSDIAS